jgi:Rod binding domain-containing protein
VTISPLSANTVSATTAPKDDPARIEEAAVQFEALLLTTLLRSAKGEESGWAGGGEDQSLSPAVGMAEEHLAAAIAHQGGLGLSKVILAQLQLRR